MYISTRSPLESYITTSFIVIPGASVVSSSLTMVYPASEIASDTLAANTDTGSTDTIISTTNATAKSFFIFFLLKILYLNLFILTAD